MRRNQRPELFVSDLQKERKTTTMEEQEVGTFMQRKMKTFEGGILLLFSGSWFYILVTTTIGLHVLMLKNTISFLILSNTAGINSLWPLLPKSQSALIGQLTHAWANIANNSPNQFLGTKLVASHKLCKCVRWWHSMMSQSHRIN